MLLPLLPTSPGDKSPYSTRSAFGLNPLFIDLSSMPEFEEAGGVAGFSPQQQEALEAARASPTIDYEKVFALKYGALGRCFQVFVKKHWQLQDARARALSAFVEAEKPWLEDFALFSAISFDRNQQAWWEWPEGLRDRHPEALESEAQRLSEQVLYQKWLQWVCDREWKTVRQKARAHGILLCGDEPFIIGQDSADAWAHRTLLRRDARLGVPPDDFSADGQDWGLPYFDFPALEKEGNAWLLYRAQKSAAYYDLRRVDHAVGYFRQYLRDVQNPKGRFVPTDEAAQQALGEHNFRLLSSGAGVVAEDLGVIPPFVRETLGGLGIPGYWVMRWSRHDGVYVPPAQYPELSLCTTGTHDTEPLSVWWESLPDWERHAVAWAYPEFERLRPPPPHFTQDVQQAFLASALSSQSRFCILPWQDILGTRDRVNLPGTLEGNWEYRIDVDTAHLLQDTRTVSAAENLSRLVQQSRP
jgi:4-alpha-glucanotransferase